LKLQKIYNNSLIQTVYFLMKNVLHSPVSKLLG